MPQLPQRSTPAEGLGRSHYADADAARQAIAMALPMLERAVEDRSVVGSGFLCIVVLDPALRHGDLPLDDAVLVEHCIGDRSRWDADYAGFARAKAALSWRHGMDSQAVQAQRAHLLGEGDSLLWGSVWLDGIVVGVSGAFPWFDEAFATAVAANLRAIAKQRQAAALDGRALAVGAPPRA